ncbi:MAG: TonB-dependent receptor [Sphingomicrobium sp.]
MAAASPATAQTPQPANPEADPCQAPSGQVDKAQCPDADTPAGEAVQQGAQVTSSADEEGIVVVGSRIRRNRFNTADPVTIITRDEQVDSGFNSTAEVLQSVGVTGGTPQINDTYGGLVTEGGPGANTLSLRGLGATRTLVLLNGRRLSPAGTRGQVGATDLNVLPNAIIDRIEVLNTGASSIYGSDAVAGVVNVVTRNKINGLTFEMQQDAPEVGAGWSSRYSLVAGATGSRWSLAGSLEWYDRKRLTQRSAKWARCPQQLRMNGIGTPRGSGDFIDPATGESKCWPLEEGGVTVNTIATGFVFTDDPADLAPGFETAPPGYNLYCNRWRPDPTNTGSLPGFQCVGGLLYNPTTGGAFGTNLNVRDTFAPSMLNQDIISPGRNYTGFLTGTYDTGAFGDGQLYAELLVTRRKSQQNGQRQFYIDYPRNSPLIPVGLRSHPLSGSTGIRAFTDYGIYDSSQTQDYIKASAGFRGDLPFLSKWRYDLYGSKSWSDGTYSFEQILADRLAQSLRVVAAPGGGFNCTVTTGGCVAAPALTPDVIAGNYHDLAWFDYITDDVVGHTKFREVTANLTLDGPLFTLPGGDASLATGIEYRKSKIADIPSSDSIRGNLYGFSSAPETIGTDWVWEAYGEVELPILAHVPFAEALTINGSARYTDYHSYGSGTTYKIGGLYSPTRWLSLRGSYGTSYRAPALFEQFLGSTTGFLANTTDPCNNLFDVTIPAVRARCLADGLPANFIQNNGVTVIQRGGAEAGLQAETSKNLTFGGVFQPTMGPAFGNLSLAVDYFDIEVDNGVSQLGAGTVANGCYQGTHPEYCQFVSRAPYTGPGTGAFTITQTYINVATDRIKGIDFVMRYDHELGRGKFSLGAEAVRTLKRINQTDPDSDPFNYIGFIGYPKWAGTGHAAFEIGSWYFRWGVEFIQGTDDTPYAVNNLGFDPDVYNFKLPDYWLHTLAVRYEDGPFSITGGVRNVFDKKPPKITAQDPFVNTIANVPLQAGYDMSGRTYFVNVRAKIF